MATSRFKTTQYSANQFVESAGAVLFHLSRRQICLVHHQTRDEWLLAKGRRNIGETRAQAALREATEETGFECDIMQLNMVTRAPPTVEVLQHYPDEPRYHESVEEPFWITVRELEKNGDVKFIWWYMAAIRGSKEADDIPQGEGEKVFKARLFGFDEALNKLTYELDRDIVKEAIKIFEANAALLLPSRAQTSDSSDNDLACDSIDA